MEKIKSYKNMVAIEAGLDQGRCQCNIDGAT